MPLAPEERIVVELGNTVEVDGVDGDDAAFAQGCEGGEDDVSAGREGDGGVERDGRALGGVANPRGAELAGQLLV